MGHLFENFDVSLGTTTSRIYLVKSQEICAISVPFNVIEMVSYIYIYIYIYSIYTPCFGLNTVKDTFLLQKLLVTVILHA